MAKRIVAFDIECYRNYFLILLKSPDGKTYKVSRYNDRVFEGDNKRLLAALKTHLIVSFNGNSYDAPMVGAFLAGYTNLELKQLSDQIILGDKPFWMISSEHRRVKIPKMDHIDLVGVTPLKSSLKTYMCRIHAPKMQDLPIHPDATIEPDQIKLLETYCENDVDGTLQIYFEQKKQIDLREDMAKLYEMDMRSMSDPQIAEAAIRKMMTDEGLEVSRREGAIKPFKYKMPDFIKFDTPELQALKQRVEDAVFTVKDTGHVQMPDELDAAFGFAGAKYKFGIGGLHSQEKKQCVIRGDETHCMGEYDVASMYPSIILGQNLYPRHLGKEFCDIYRTIFDTRIQAKRAGNKVTADTLKIVLNSSYGKFGSKYSFLYAPELLIQTTITGQLSLMMLIERITETGAWVISANTDGVVVHMDYQLKPTVDRICEEWTSDTTYVLEWTPYDAMYSRDVNSYIAFKGDEVKTKGAYEYGGIRKGYSNEICLDAVIEFLRHGTDVSHVIRDCSDVTKFLTMRGVRGGAVWRGAELGKTVRWYVGLDGEPIRYVKNGNKVAGSDGAVPMMDLTDMPSDIDYVWYEDRAKKLIKDLGILP